MIFRRAALYERRGDRIVFQRFQEMIPGELSRLPARFRVGVASPLDYYKVTGQVADTLLAVRE